MYILVLCPIQVNNSLLPTRVFTSFRIKTVAFRMVLICDVVFGLVYILYVCDLCFPTEHADFMSFHIAYISPPPPPPPVYRSKKSEVSRFFTHIKVLKLLGDSVSVYKPFKHVRANFNMRLPRGGGGGVLWYFHLYVEYFQIYVGSNHFFCSKSWISIFCWFSEKWIYFLVWRFCGCILGVITKLDWF